MSETAHTGRGGAGNVGAKSPPPQEESFKTPTLKQAHYTTGRGGSGNIVSNDSADNARLAQDVEAPLAAARDAKGPVLVGRGGGGNVVTTDAPANGGGKPANGGAKPEKPVRRGSGVLDRAKETLGLKKSADKQ